VATTRSCPTPLRFRTWCLACDRYGTSSGPRSRSLWTGDQGENWVRHRPLVKVESSASGRGSDQGLPKSGLSTKIGDSPDAQRRSLTRRPKCRAPRNDGARHTPDHLPPPTQVDVGMTFSTHRAPRRKDGERCPATPEDPESGNRRSRSSVSSKLLHGSSLATRFPRSALNEPPQRKVFRLRLGRL
jgi:hypothetical protein